MAVAAIACNNKCTAYFADRMSECVKTDRPVTCHRYTGNGPDVVLIQIDEGKHSWAAADIDTGEIICRFFNKYR